METTTERIEREAVNEASMIQAEPWIRREAHITISRKMKSERNTTIDEVIELIKDFGPMKTMFGVDECTTDLIREINELKVK